MEGKKGRMSRVYTAPGKKAPEAAIKNGGKSKDPAMKHSKPPKTPKMGG
jgi:hypothetical protein